MIDKPNPSASASATAVMLQTIALAALLGWCATSASAQDTTPPGVVSAGSLDGNTIGLCFNEPVDAASASTPSNYSINGVSEPTAVTLRADGTSVILLLNVAVAGNFVVTVNNVQDLAGNAIAPGSSAPGTVAGYSSADIEAPVPAGEAFSCSSGSITVTAGGRDIWDTHDQFTFVYKAVEGDFDVQVRLESLEYVGNRWSKAGLMIRENLTPGSRHHDVFVTPGEGANAYQVESRSVQDALTDAWGSVITGVPYPDAWIRLQRSGDSLNAFRGTDGVNWEPLAFATPPVPYPSIVFVGLLTCAQQADSDTFQPTTARYHSLNLIASTPAHPFVTSVSPQGNRARADETLTIRVQDGTAQLDPASVHLSLDGVAVAASVSKVAGTTTIAYDPPGFFSAGSAHTIELTFTDNAVPPLTQALSFTFGVANYVGPNGNLYEIVRAPGIRWEDAKAAAEQRTYLGRAGRLATITSAEEDLYIFFLSREAGLSGAGGEVWAGAFQLPNQASPSEGWMWLNDEGPVSSYVNWYFGEPNDCCATSYSEDNEENFLGLGLFGSFGWNDNANTHLADIGGYVVEYDRVTVLIDIKPGSYPNAIYLDAPGKLAVAILTTATFDASTVDPATVTFGRTGTEANPLTYSLSDVNKDKRPDLVCHFSTQYVGLLCGDTVARLKASTFSGTPIVGSDSVRILRCPPYSLAIQSLQDVNHLTDVYLTVTPILEGHTAPSVAQNLVLKSYDIFSHLRWTKTLQNLGLTANPDGTARASLQYADMEHGQNVKAQMQVKDVPTGVIQLLHTEGRVLFRPDLAVQDISAPSQANIRQVVNIFASLRELRGDLGATANVYLYDGDSLIDIVPGISVAPLDSVGLLFATTFQSEGVHQLKIVVGDVSPGDFDLSNNTQEFTIEVFRPALEPVFYCAGYSYFDQDYESVVETPYWISTYRQQYTNESTSQTLYIPAAIDFPVGRVSLKITADGIDKDDLEALNIPLSWGYSDGCFSYQNGFQYLGDNVFLFIDVYEDVCFGYQTSYVSFNKYAADVMFFSSFFDKIYGGGYEFSSSFGYGTLLKAASSVDTRFIVEAAVGAFGGGGTVGPLFEFPYDYSWDYFWFDSHYSGHSRGKNVFGSNCDMTTP